MTITEMARKLGISRAAVRKHVLAGMPINTLRAARIWRDENLDPARVKRALSSPAGSAANGSTSLNAARTARMIAEATLAELQLLEKKGVVEHIEVARARYSRQLSDLRGALLNLPGRLASMLATEPNPERCGALIRDELEQVFAMMAGQVET